MVDGGQKLTAHPEIHHKNRYTPKIHTLRRSLAERSHKLFKHRHNSVRLKTGQNHHPYQSIMEPLQNKIRRRAHRLKDPLFGRKYVYV